MGLNNSASVLNELTIIQPLVNPIFGVDMNQNISFGGTPVLIHDGEDNVGWTPSVVQGNWDFVDTTDPFAGTNHISLTTANDQDMAVFNDSIVDMADRTTITGRVKLITYDNRNDITIRFQNNNVDVGNSVNLNDFINENALNSYQPFVIPKGIFGITNEDVDEFQITISRNGAPKPTIFFDVIQVEETGTPATFSFKPTTERVFLKEVQLFIVDEVSDIGLLDYNTLLDLASLNNGITVRAFSFKEAVFSGTFHRLIDFLQIPDATLQTGSNGTESWAQIRFDFRQHSVILDNNDFDGVFFTIDDDLSGLLEFRTFLRFTKRL